MHARLLLSFAVLALDGPPCGGGSKSAAGETVSVPVVAEKAPSFDKLPRLDFNRRAAERYLNVFWRTDPNKNGALDPEELAVLWGYGELKRDELIDGKGFTPRFAK